MRFAFHVALIVLAAILAASFATQTDAADSSTRISGGDLPRTVKLAFPDEDAFFRRLDPPPEPDEAPLPAGLSYLISSGYWDQALRGTDGAETPAAPEAAYYPQTGYARVRQGAEDVWLLLNQRQRAVLDRYIRLAREGRIGERPGALEVAAAASAGEPISIEVAGTTLTQGIAQAFWQIFVRDARVRFVDPPQPPVPLVSGAATWVIFTLPEGRSLQYLYDPDNRLLRDSFGTEAYDVSSSLGSMLVTASAPLEIEQEEGRGSRVWWLVMVGGGLGCLAAALWLRRRSA